MACEKTSNYLANCQRASKENVKTARTLQPEFQEKPKQIAIRESKHINGQGNIMTLMLKSQLPEEKITSCSRKHNPKLYETNFQIEHNPNQKAPMAQVPVSTRGRKNISSFQLEETIQENQAQKRKGYCFIVLRIF